MKTLGLACLLAIAGCVSPAPGESILRIEPRLGVEDGGNSYERLNKVGLQLAADGRYEQAIRHFRAALALAPQLAYLHNNLGYAYLLGGANPEALRSFEEAVRLDAQYGKALENLRVARLRLPASAPKQAAARASSTETPLREVAPHVYELIAAPKAPARPVPQRAPRLQVVNGNGAPGMARRVAAELGLRAARLSNQRPFVQRVSEIQYRDGYADAAIALSKKLHGTVRAVRVDGLAGGTIDMRLVLGKDRLGSAT
jgi:tetratricopeptide (TPR) repeat protein